MFSLFCKCQGHDNLLSVQNKLTTPTEITSMIPVFEYYYLHALEAAQRQLKKDNPEQNSL